MTPCRELNPITPADLGAVECYLDATANPLVNISVARRLMGHLRHLEARVATAEAEADAAWSLLTADLRDKTTPPPTQGA